MACSKSLYTPRPSVILLGLFVLASLGTTFHVQASPVPDNGKSVEAHFNDGVKAADDFIQRAKNTFTGRADST